MGNIFNYTKIKSRNISIKEFNFWKLKCPIEKFKNKLLKSNIPNKNNIQDIENKIEKKINSIFKYAKMSPMPDYNKGNLNVYAK